jgi:hypothetical protein
MPDQCKEDANPQNNACVLVENFIVCAREGELNPNEIRATYYALLPHMDTCWACIEILEESGLSIPCSNGGEVCSFTEKEIFAFVKASSENNG